MEVHRPKPAHGWRMFLGEVGIIVLGVLIALIAEQTVRALEWRHKVHAAEAAMAAELRDDDGPQAYARAAMHDCLQQELDALRAAVETAAPRAEVLRRIDAYKVSFWTWDSLAYTAAMNGELSTHMETEALSGWTSAYATMTALDRANQKEFADTAELHALSRTGGALSETERQALLHAVETLRRDDLTIMSAVRVMLPAIAKAGVSLKAEDRQRMLKMVRGTHPGCNVQPPESLAAAPA
jgi:hypothetical protein